VTGWSIASRSDPGGRSAMRRFIAGAVCPQCRAIDRILVEAIEAGRQRRCVACGHAEALVETLAAEPATRFTSRANEATPVQPIRFMDPRSPGSESNAEASSE